MLAWLCSLTFSRQPEHRTAKAGKFTSCPPTLLSRPCAGLPSTRNGLVWLPRCTARLYRHMPSTDRKEALPVPLVSCGCVGNAGLLFIHASHHYANARRRAALYSRQPALRGRATHRCYATETTSIGQPFAVALAGLTGRSAQSCWTLHWLAALRVQAQSFGCPKDFDFLWPSSAPEMSALPQLAPASYCTAMLTMRWAATLPWRPPGQGLTSNSHYTA